MKDIIEAAPHLSGDILSIRKQDIEIERHGRTGPHVSPIQSVQLLLEIAPTISLELDDAPTLVIPSAQDSSLASASAQLSRELELVGHLSATTTGNVVILRAELKLPSIPEATIDVFAHWGSYEELSPQWQDEKVALHSGPRGTSCVTHRLHVLSRGEYGATLYAQVRGSSERIWIGSPGSSDAHFFIAHDDLELVRQREAENDALAAWSLATLGEAVRYGRNLDDACDTILKKYPMAPLGELLRTVCHEPTISAAALSTTSRSASLSALMQMNFGIGEVVFTTPEGPHAAAGGLAQVISGLPPELARAGIPATIIAPLYHYENGNKHPDAQRTLSHGIKLGDVLVKPTYVGSVTVHVGPTYSSGTSNVRRMPSAIPIKVYSASNKNLRIFLLSNASVFDRLYQPVFADEQLRRSIILSRATLETIASKQFGIRPSVLISNDWMTACVPAFCALDESYQRVPWLASCKTVHMIHNGGADYHGRLPNNVNHEDLWPMLNLAPEHFFGFRDPHNYALMNFSMAAAHHASGGVLTVSKPYAESLLAENGGDGLEYVLAHKRNNVFGISNGINRPEVDRYLSVISGREGEPFASMDELLACKRETKMRIQQRYGLTVAPEARLVSFVGRMAEQKGLSLLSGFVAGANTSTLENILTQHPDVQILIAGPSTSGDASSLHIRNTLDYLSALYPGRVRAVFDYVPHSTAIEIIFGSTFFLMPSRFEPGGITQLEALATGTLVIGRNVGGISSTIVNFDPQTGRGNGFLCNDYDPTAFAGTCHWALSETRCDETYSKLVRSALEARHSWSDRVENYRTMLRHVILGNEAPSHGPH